VKRLNGLRESQMHMIQNNISIEKHDRKTGMTKEDSDFIVELASLFRKTLNQCGLDEGIPQAGLWFALELHRDEFRGEGGGCPRGQIYSV